MTRDPRLVFGPPVPGMSYLLCPLCLQEIHRTHPDDRRLPGVIAFESEGAAIAHLAKRHRLRYWLWRRLQWGWLIRELRP